MYKIINEGPEINIHLETGDVHLAEKKGEWLTLRKDLAELLVARYPWLLLIEVPKKAKGTVKEEVVEEVKPVEKEPEVETEPVAEKPKKKRVKNSEK